ncbi:MAG: hypothetical protein ACREQV_05280, partial [Candidatus Binatia bacterium]
MITASTLGEFTLWASLVMIGLLCVVLVSYALSTNQRRHHHHGSAGSPSSHGVWKWVLGLGLSLMAMLVICPLSCCVMPVWLLLSCTDEGENEYQSNQQGTLSHPAVTEARRQDWEEVMEVEGQWEPFPEAFQVTQPATGSYQWGFAGTLAPNAEPVRLYVRHGQAGNALLVDGAYFPAPPTFDEASARDDSGSYDPLADVIAFEQDLAMPMSTPLDIVSPLYVMSSAERKTTFEVVNPKPPGVHEWLV